MWLLAHLVLILLHFKLPSFLHLHPVLHCLLLPFLFLNLGLVLSYFSLMQRGESTIFFFCLLLNQMRCQFIYLGRVPRYQPNTTMN